MGVNNLPTVATQVRLVRESNRRQWRRCAVRVASALSSTARRTKTNFIPMRWSTLYSAAISLRRHFLVTRFFSNKNVDAIEGLVFRIVRLLVGVCCAGQPKKLWSGADFDHILRNDSACDRLKNNKFWPNEGSHTAHFWSHLCSYHLM